MSYIGMNIYIKKEREENKKVIQKVNTLRNNNNLNIGEI
jgi:hypothetical protein